MFETLGLFCRHALRILIVKNVTELPIQYILKRWTKDAKKDSVLCDHVKPASANDELSMTSRCNELMHSIYEIFTKSAATTRHIEMCQRKVRVIIELVENDMEQSNATRDGDKKEIRIVVNNVFDDVVTKRSHKCKTQK